jgi:Flp pilus assembly protein TadD
MYAQLPPNLDGGVGQLLRYCSKFQNSGDLVTAAGLCERAHRMDPTNPAPLMQLADILVAMKQPQQAITAYHTIIATAPDNTDAHYALGKLYIGLGQYDLAAAAFQAALRSKTDDPRIYNALGVAHGLVGANASALQAFEAGLAVGPKHISLRNNFGLSLVLRPQCKRDQPTQSPARLWHGDRRRRRSGDHEGGSRRGRRRAGFSRRRGDRPARRDRPGGSGCERRRATRPQGAHRTDPGSRTGAGAPG